MVFLGQGIVSRPGVITAIATALLLGSCASDPRLQIGPDAVVTADGLHQVENVPFGSLFMRPDYAFGSYDQFVLGETHVTFEPGAPMLSFEDTEDLKARFNRIAREVISESGREEVAAPGPCVAEINLALVDLDVVNHRASGGAGTSVVSSFGAVTLVLEIRDGQTSEPLLRYGRRRPLVGGVDLGADPSRVTVLETAFERFALDFNKDFTRSLPQVPPAARTLTCAQRAGLEPFTPDLDAAAEIEQALGLTPDPESGRRIYETCAGCHQTSGAGEGDGSVPQIAGQHREVVIKQLADIRAGNRDNPTMYPFAYADQIGGAQAIADVAAYIGTLPIRTDTGKGPGDDLGRGETVYAEHCAACHGPAGEGSAERAIPLIQAQHFRYLVRQFQRIKDGQRRNADPGMVAQIQVLSGEETQAVLDYVSRLAPADVSSRKATTASGGSVTAID